MTRWTGLLLLLVGALVILVAAPFIGPISLPFAAVFDPFGAESSSRIFWQIRVPRVVAAFLGGAGLAVGGAVFQAVFRNPLATPYILGVAAGASFGVAAVARIGIGSTRGRRSPMPPRAPFSPDGDAKPWRLS